jgi:hypothetical protein
MGTDSSGEERQGAGARRGRTALSTQVECWVRVVRGLVTEVSVPAGVAFGLAARKVSRHTFL